MNRQNVIVSILVVLLIALAVGGYLLYQKQLKAYNLFPRTLAYEEVERFIVNCQVYSIGRSHKDIEMGSLTISLKDRTEDWLFKVDKKYERQIREKVEEVTSSGKCPKVTSWME